MFTRPHLGKKLDVVVCTSHPNDEEKLKIGGWRITVQAGPRQKVRSYFQINQIKTKGWRHGSNCRVPA
jgi:hypothetical protein